MFQFINKNSLYDFYILRFSKDQFFGVACEHISLFFLCVVLGMEDGVELWWKTTSVCVVCMLADQKSDYYTKAAVVRENKGRGRVWLVSFCVRHGKHETLLSSDAEFLKRVLSQRLRSVRVSFFSPSSPLFVFIHYLSLYFNRSKANLSSTWRNCTLSAKREKGQSL